MRAGGGVAYMSGEERLTGDCRRKSRTFVVDALDKERMLPV
jgi:hypothetical protein